MYTFPLFTVRDVDSTYLDFSYTFCQCVSKVLMIVMLLREFPLIDRSFRSVPQYTEEIEVCVGLHLLSYIESCFTRVFFETVVTYSKYEKIGIHLYY